MQVRPRLYREALVQEQQTFRQEVWTSFLLPSSISVSSMIFFAVTVFILPGVQALAKLLLERNR